MDIVGGLDVHRKQITEVLSNVVDRTSITRHPSPRFSRLGLIRFGGSPLISVQHNGNGLCSRTSNLKQLPARADVADRSSPARTFAS